MSNLRPAEILPVWGFGSTHGADSQGKRKSCAPSPLADLGGLCHQDPPAAWQLKPTGANSYKGSPCPVASADQDQPGGVSSPEAVRD